MGKSTSSCFKLISCGDHDSVDRDDLQAPEVKHSSDKRKWSFRKKSATDRVLDNYVVSETSSGNKASPDTATASFQTQPDIPTPEKSSENLQTENETLVLKPETNSSETVDAIHPDTTTTNLNESVVIVIQAAIRGFMAERLLWKKKKNIIKLQAAARGHIVRRHAIGSLRCIQAIVKMQALVRGRRARILLLEESRTVGYKGKLDHLFGKENQSSTPQARVEYTSIHNLLKNSFARQLLESKQSTETMNFKCDPLKSDSAWRWLERWMSTSSNGSDQSLKFESSVEQNSNNKSNDATSPRDNSSYIHTKLSPQESEASSEGDENVITYEVCSHDESDGLRPSLSSLSGDVNKPYFINSFDKALNPPLDDQIIESNFVSETRTDSPNQSHPEETETTENNLLFGSGKSIGLPNQDMVSPVSNFMPMEIIPVKHSVLPPGGSECGTELSITSTLDSPDRPEIGQANNDKEGIVALEAEDEYKKNLPDSQDTPPSGHASVKPKKNSNPKHSTKAKHSDKNYDSGVRNSSEQVSKNQKTGKRRESTGSVKTDNDDHEPRDSSSSNSLPSYMQATESARAKAAANSSPRSSPDVLSKDSYVKKRRSLPGSNTKQGSPRVHLPLSQSPQTVNPNGILSPQERKWKR